MSVLLRPGESQDGLLKRFRREVIHGRILSTHRRKRWFVSKGSQRRYEREKAIRRMRHKEPRRVSDI